MNQLTVVLITALVTGVISISGIWFGSHLTRDNEDRKWRRDHSLEAYSQFIQAVEIVRSESDLIYILECKTEEHHKQHEVVFDKTFEMDLISQRVYLLAPDAVKVRMRALTHHMRTEFAAKSIKCPKIEESERKSAMMKGADLLVHFINEARNDLGVHPPLNTYEEWSQILDTKQRSIEKINGKSGKSGTDHD